MWHFYPPDQLKYLLDCHGNLVYDIRNYDSKDFPELSKAKSFQVIQNEGETIFVPSCWYHQVENLEDTISINHNWGNGCNIGSMWNLVKDDLKNVREALSKIGILEGFEEQCQVVLLANSGIDFNDFIDYLTHGFHYRFKNNSSTKHSEQMILEKVTEKYKEKILEKMLEILGEMDEDPFVKLDSGKSIREKIKILREKIHEELKLK